MGANEHNKGCSSSLFLLIASSVLDAQHSFHCLGRLCYDSFIIFFCVQHAGVHYFFQIFFIWRLVFLYFRYSSYNFHFCSRYDLLCDFECSPVSLAYVMISCTFVFYIHVFLSGFKFLSLYNVFYTTCLCSWTEIPIQLFFLYSLVYIFVGTNVLLHILSFISLVLYNYAHLRSTRLRY